MIAILAIAIASCSILISFNVCAEYIFSIREYSENKVTMKQIYGTILVVTLYHVYHSTGIITHLFTALHLNL